MSKTKYIETPEKLWDLFCEYRKWCKDNPKLKQDFVGKDADEVERKLERPLTFEGFEVYLSDKDIIEDLGDYDKNKDDRYLLYAPIITRIKKVVTGDQLEGATVGIYNHHIVARKLGLIDKTETKVETSGELIIKGEKFANKD